MGRVKQIRLPDGQTADADDMQFVVDKDPWTEIRLDDGTILQMKHAISEVLRIKGAVNDIGEPIFMVRSTNVVKVLAGRGSQSTR